MRAFARSSIITVIPLVTLASELFYAAYATEAELSTIMNRMETDVKKLAENLEELFASRCDSDYAAECAMGSYEECLSEFPSASCSATDLVIPECDNISCGARLDYTVSSVHLPLAVYTQDTPGNPGPLNAKEAICYSLQAEDLMNKICHNYDEWRGSYPPSIFFGSDSGVFRILPARQTKECNKFDPRLRPWYIAASSVPKDVVLIIDFDQPTTYSSRMDKIKGAATWVINNTLNVNDTLTVGDFVAVIESNNKTIDNSDYLQIVTAGVKEDLIDRIKNSMHADGNDFYDLFDLAFRILRESEDKSLTTNCRRAILYMTDKTTLQDGSRNVSDVQDLWSNYTDLELPAIFTFSFGSNIEEGDAKSIACATRGVWTAVEDDNDGLAAAMGGYYKYFAYGLGNVATVENDPRFVSWVEPYIFLTTAVNGTTVSAPVYDTRASPPVFIGVVGLDMTLTAMRNILGKDKDPSAFEEILRQKRSPVCPTLTLEQCQIQSLRKIANPYSEIALCEEECTNFTSEACSSEIYPTDYWANTNYKEKEKFEDRVCCSAEQCPVDDVVDDVVDDDDDDGVLVGIIVGSAAGGIIVLVVGVAFYYKYCRQRTQSSSQRHIELRNQRYLATRERAVQATSNSYADTLRAN